MVARHVSIRREVGHRDRIKDYFVQDGEKFQAEWADELPKDEEITVYRLVDWLDMCLGPHLPSTGKLGKAFKLTKVSGAYWRRDPKNAQLQRGYGTLFFSDQEPEGYLHRIQATEKRDHPRPRPDMSLFPQPQ